MNGADIGDGIERLVDRLSSRNYLMRLLRKRILGGKPRAREELLSLALAIWPDRRILERTRTAISAKLDKGVGIYGLFHAEVGIGQSARRCALSFQAVGFPVSCHAIPGRQWFEDRVPFDTTTDLNTCFDTALMHFNADAMPSIVPLLPPDLFRARRSIAFWHWELPIFPARWMSAFDYFDEIWVPSRFTAASIATATDKPIRIVPHAIPQALVEKNTARQLLALPTDDFIVLATFDSNSWVTRKNPVGAVKAFLDAFPRKPVNDTRLIVKLHGRTQRNASYDDFRRLAATDDRILIIDEVYDEDQMIWLQNACDVYLSLHRSEGYGLNMAECMAIGKLVVATDFSGNVDFMNRDNSIPIPYKIVAVGPGEYLHGDGQWWADPDHNAAVEALRFAFGDVTDAKRLRYKAMKDIALYNSFDRVGRIAVSALNGATRPADAADTNPVSSGATETTGRARL
jgi:glycosyltransferase involved in cell wall biosynthesis